MNFRERFTRTLNFEPVDQIPCMDFGYWPDTIKRWQNEGLPNGIRSISQVEDYLGLDRGYLCWHKSFDPEVEHNEVLYVEVNWFDYWGDIYPPYPEETLDEQEETKVIRTAWGVVMRVRKGVEAMPQFLEYPVKNLDDYVEVKKRLDGRHPARYPADWEERIQGYRSSDKPLGLYVMGIFGGARELMGLVNLSYAYYDQPELISAMAEHQTNFIMEAYDRVTKDLDIDFVITFEDMCYNSGCLISPKMFEKFVAPYYEQITKFFKDRGVKKILVDSDGNVVDLMSRLLEVGVDGCVPCEVNAGSEPAVLRDKYPGLCMMGGIDKMAVIEGPDAIDKEMEKLPPLLEKGGFIPGFDHLVPSTVSFDNYRHFCDQRKKYVERYHP